MWLPKLQVSRHILVYVKVFWNIHLFIQHMLLYNIFILWGQIYSQTCRTENDKTCNFPFDYNGITYEACTNDGMPNPWCYTTDGKWGICENSCKVEPGIWISKYVSKLIDNIIHYIIEFVCWQHCTHKSSYLIQIVVRQKVLLRKERSQDMRLVSSKLWFKYDHI